MELVRAWEEQGVEIPSPYRRRIKVLFAPDKGGVNEITFSHAIISPGGKTDYHVHDRPELIYVVSGEGIAVGPNKEEIPICADVAMWVPGGEGHQIINTGYVPVKLATVFLPGYTAEENYNRCMAAALELQDKQSE